MFNIPPNEVKLVFIVNKIIEDQFLEFLRTYEYTWLEKDFTKISNELEKYGILLIYEDDSRLPRLFEKLYNFYVIYYAIGAHHLFTSSTVDPFNHDIYVKKDQFNLFLKRFKEVYEMDFIDDILKSIK